ncbi:MAG TPA: excinuclease ABC subunit UvrC [Actinopolymorphaceae bacterium]|jgi:excinuclease ABC subunit C
MADPSTYRPAPGSIPTNPGVYRFVDDTGRVIYVGKAKSLRSRVNSYFADLTALHPRTQAMVTSASRVQWTTVNTEVEALALEYSWIKEFDPRFNVRYRDDKTYPWLAVTLNEDYPRLLVMRGPKRKGVRYFGPYAHAWAIRETLDLLLRVFPARTCSKGVFNRSRQIDRPCLLGYIGKCSAPCVGRVNQEEHREIVEDFCDFMAGNADKFTRRIEKDMHAASDELDFERAARLRDDLGAMRRALEKNAVVLSDGTDADVIGFAEDELELAVQIFHVRGGRIRGQRGWIADKVDDADTGGHVEAALLQLYGSQATDIDGITVGPSSIRDTVPKEILVPALPSDPNDVHVLTEWLSLMRGSNVSLRVAQRGDKATLAQTVTRNAEQALVIHKTKRASDLSTRGQALEQIAEALGLDEVPLRIECYDISNLQATDVVASMVVFEDGLPRKADYRRFSIRGIDGSHDTAALAETLKRRFARYQHEQAELAAALAAAKTTSAGGDVDGTAGIAALIDPETGRRRRFAYAPGLVVVDGGAPQVQAAREAMDEMGLQAIPVCGLAKRLEEVWLPGEDDPVIMARTSEGLYLLQRVRDEAHRFAITYHRNKRSTSMMSSVLDEIPGLGPTRRKALLREFGSMKRLRAATAEEVAEVDGIGPATAASVVDALAAAAPGRPAINTATGEILE